jgi:cobalt transporter subunit CbtA
MLMTALLAGFLGGAGISIVHEFTTTPLILQAEEYESKDKQHAYRLGGPASPGEARLILAHGSDTHANGVASAEKTAWAPAEGMERMLSSALVNIITGVGFSLILVACFALSGKAVDGRRGVLWGIAGFTIINLAPALGLPPEVPGTVAAELAQRQTWWFLCIAATGAGLWMLIFRHGAIWMVAGIALMAIPHIAGAPQPVRMGGLAPPELAGQFAAASLVTAAIFWTALGWLSGTFWHKFAAKA